MSFGDGDLHERVADLEAENNKLRYLVETMRREMRPVESDVFLLGWIDSMIADLRIEVG